MSTGDAHRKWAETIIKRFAPSYRHRWEIYDGILRRLTGAEARWLDAGCGSNVAVAEFPSRLNVGIDVVRHPYFIPQAGVHYVEGDLERLPFSDGSFTLVSLNTVAEHLREPATVMAEIRRVLAPGGHLLVHTTNRRSPLIMLSRMLPEGVRNALFRRVFAARDEDVFPAFHRLNTTTAFRSIAGIEVEEMHLNQFLHWTNRGVFVLLFLYHLVTSLPGLRGLRTNIIVLLRRTE